MSARAFERMAVVFALLAIAAAMVSDAYGMLSALVWAAGFLLGAVILYIFATWMDVDEMLEQEILERDDDAR
jgi:hypothetical protein